MFPCSTLQKPDWEQYFPDRPRYWLADATLCIQTCRCSIPCKTCSWCTSLAVPANSQLSLSEGCSGKALQDITFFLAFMFRGKLPHQAGDLSCCGPSAPSFLSHISLPAPSSEPPLHHFPVSSLL